MGACGSACKGKVGASAPAVKPEAKADATAESTIMQPIEAACDQPEDAKRIVEAAGKTQADAKEVANDGAPVLEGADVGKAFGWCCAPTPAVQLEVKADANAESTEMQLVEAACDQPEDAKRADEVATESAGETQADSKEVANDGAPVLEGADAGKAFGWCCAPAPAVQLEVEADANAESTEMQPIDAECDQTEDAKGTDEVAADVAGEMPDDVKEVANDGAPVLEGADAGKAFGWCCQVESASRG